MIWALVGALLAAAVAATWAAIRWWRRTAPIQWEGPWTR